MRECLCFLDNRSFSLLRLSFPEGGSQKMVKVGDGGWSREPVVDVGGTRSGSHGGSAALVVRAANESE